MRASGHALSRLQYQIVMLRFNRFHQHEVRFIEVELRSGFADIVHFHDEYWAITRAGASQR